MNQESIVIFDCPCVTELFDFTQMDNTFDPDPAKT